MTKLVSKTKANQPKETKSLPYFSPITFVHHLPDGLEPEAGRGHEEPLPV